MIQTIVFDVSSFSFLCHNWIHVINHFPTDSSESVPKYSLSPILKQQDDSKYSFVKMYEIHYLDFQKIISQVYAM